MRQSSSPRAVDRSSPDGMRRGAASWRHTPTGTRSLNSTAPRRVSEPKTYEETSNDGQIWLAVPFDDVFAFCHIGPGVLDAHKARFSPNASFAFTGKR